MRACFSALNHHHSWPGAGSYKRSAAFTKRDNTALHIPSPKRRRRHYAVRRLSRRRSLAIARASRATAATRHSHTLPTCHFHGTLAEPILTRNARMDLDNTRLSCSMASIPRALRQVRHLRCTHPKQLQSWPTAFGSSSCKSRTASAQRG